jgi:hypothetical protein
MKLPLPLAATLLGLVLPAIPASAQIITASHAGQYSSAGDFAGDNTNYVTGAFEGEYRSFFVFDLPTFSLPIVSAKLDLYNFGGSDDIPAGFYSENPSETLSFFNYSGSLAALTTGGSGLTGIFADLGSGSLYGSTTVGAGNDGQYVSLFLNNAFLADLNAASGGTIAFGSALTSLVDPNGYAFIFGNTDLSSANPAVRLTLVAASASTSAVPEPSTYALAASVLLGAVILRRRQQQQRRES